MGSEQRGGEKFGVVPACVVERCLAGCRETHVLRAQGLRVPGVAFPGSRRSEDAGRMNSQPSLGLERTGGI